MTAKDMLGKLGYKIKEDSDEGIQFRKIDPESEMERVGMVTTKDIEFYHRYKEILISSSNQFRNGKTSKSDSAILSLEEYKAIHQQTIELGWL